MFMKSLMWLTLMLSACSLMFGLNGNIAVADQQTDIVLQSNTQTGLTVHYNVGSLIYEEINTQQGNFTQLDIEGYASTNRNGLPELPLLRKIIRVPLNASIVPQVTSRTSTTVSLAALGLNNPLLPRQESVAKDQDPASLPFSMDRTFYSGTGWTNEPTVKVEEIGMLRGARLVALDFTPVQYNPASGELEVVTSATIQVSFVGADWALTQQMYEKYYSSAFEPMLAQSVFNYENSRPSLDRYPLGLVIIAPASYESTLVPFINWKERQGYNVTFATTAIAGTTTTAIKTYLQNIWDSATTSNPAPSYLILVGDTGQIPAWAGSTSGGHITDLAYVRLQGTDYVPEMYFGRFSAATVAQCQVYVDKSLQYEMYTMPDPSYLSYTTLIAGVDATYGPTHANGQINYGMTQYYGQSTAPNWTPYGPYNIRNHMYLYPASGNSETSIIADMNAGLGFINYTAHGSETTWYDPSLTIANINGLTNANKYFVAIGNCCLTNAFNTAECFGEAFTRVANKGAVAYVGGTNSTYWNEDYYWAVGYKPPVVGTGSPYQANRIGAYDALFHYHDEAFADWASTMGSMVYMGNLAVVASNSNLINYYWEIYSIMGDPSLIPYMGLPTVLTAEYVPTVQIGLSTMQIQTDPYTYVAISQNNELHGVGLADASGALTLTFTPFINPGAAQLVFTRNQRQPLIADLQVTSGTGPYLLVNSMTVNDGNNAIAEAGETLYLDLIVNNVGTQNASNVTVTLTSASPYVNIINGTTTLPSVQMNTPLNVGSTFQVGISPNIPDQEVVQFHFVFTTGTGNWTADRSITVNAPDLSFSAPSYFDPNNNGAFEQGEMITVSFNISNTGHMNAEAGVLNVVINSDAATVSQNSFTLPGLNTGVTIPLNFQITIATTATNGTVIPVGMAYTAGAQMVNDMFALPVGAFGEGFESNGFSTFPWLNASTIPWTIVNGANNFHTGNYSAKSGTIGNNGLTELSVSMNIGMAGNITFWSKVSSESGYDFLKFYIDSTEQGSWSGLVSWTQSTFPVTTGQHTFKWTYSKDYSSVGGSDCGWVDDIVFPVSGNSSVPIFFLPTTALNFNQVVFNTVVSQDLVLRNLGSAALTGTITVPSVVSLLFNGAAVSDTYSYSLPAFSSGTFTISLYLTSPTVLNDHITFTSNDANHPGQQVVFSVTTPNDDPNVIPTVTKLEGNYPNPFNPSTTVRFALKAPSATTIHIYNSKGQLVRTLVDENMKAGNHSVVWNGIDNSGKAVSSGIYMYRMQADGVSQTRKMMLMK